MPTEPLYTGKSKRTAPPLHIPPIGTNALERKRQLNVLAQRNYRRRKREHLQNLEAQVEAKAKAAEHQYDDGKSRSVHPAKRERNLLADPPGSSDPSHRDVCSPTNFVDPACLLLTGSSTKSNSIPDGELESMVPRYDDGMEIAINYPTSLSPLPSSPLGQFSPLQLGDFIDMSDGHEDQNYLHAPSHDESQLSALLATTPPRGPSPNPQAASRSKVYSFPDDRNLPIFELSLLRGSLAIAERLQISPDLIWDPTAVSPFSDPANSHRSFDHLPMQFRPTPAQRQYPHHPMLDLLPWAVARTKMIVIFTQPPSVRPPAARSETALMDMLYDADDGAEGMKVWGADPLNPNNWEIGETLWRRWWWAFDRDIVTQSNKWRRERGAPPLGGGKVLGEAS